VVTDAIIRNIRKSMHGSSISLQQVPAELI
jgi:hypothetical protein